MMNGRGLRELHSSELQIRGGTGFFSTLVEKIRNLIDTLVDYLPNLMKGIKDGFLGNDMAK